MLSKSEVSYFKAARAVSELSDHPHHRLGCVVIDKHRIISSGCNSKTKTNPLQARIDTKRFGTECPGKVHSETAALIPLIKENIDLSSATLYVYREHKDGTPAMARPCPGCMSLIKACNIRRIKYSTNDGFASEEIG